jgi:polyribonucleotide nucleotidyltransferase
MTEKNFELELAGRKLKVNIGQMANQANGSVLVSYGETTILSTAVMSKEEKDCDYFPLMVDYEERFYAAGKIKGSRFIKRETRPPDEAILAARLVDLTIRPLFSDACRREVQVINTVLSYDGENDPDMVALWGSSLALAISDIPWQGPVSGVRVSRLDNQWIFNPTQIEKEKSNLDLVVCGHDERVIMLEAGAQEISEEDTYQAIEVALPEIDKLNKFFEEIKKQAGKEKIKLEDKKEEKEEKEERKIVADFFVKEADSYLFAKPLKSKADRIVACNKIREILEQKMVEKNIGKDRREKVAKEIDKMIYRQVSNAILERSQRIDGRDLIDVRQLEGKVNVLPQVHGSGIFSRGETQILSIVTLGAPGMEQYLDTMEKSGTKHFMHHYNFPPYSVGEVSSLRSTGRREVGHSALAERGLWSIMPEKETFPYTVRVVSEALSSNGSTSMASACAASLALMDAGVPIKKPVAGIAVGLASEEDEKGITKFKTFLDLQDVEDGPGGMDFKVIGTREGLTAIQMDTKTKGLSMAIVKEALDKAKVGRLKILDFIESILKKPRESLSAHAPQICSFQINPKKIRDVIGPGGKMINEIIAQTNTTIDVEQDGWVAVTAANGESLKKACDWIKDITKELKIGETYQGKIKRMVEFGAFVELLSGDSGLIHVSEMAPFRVNKPSDLLEEGEMVPVKLIKIDEQGRMNFSLKQAAGPEFYEKKKKN